MIGLISFNLFYTLPVVILGLNYKNIKEVVSKEITYSVIPINLLIMIVIFMPIVNLICILNSKIIITIE